MQEWEKPDRLRDPWYIGCGDGSPFPYDGKPSQPWSGTVQTEVTYRGYRIVLLPYNGTFDKSDSMGFDVPAAFAVLDDFDEPALPYSHHWFWSPWDARNAIDFYEWVKTVIDKKKWPTSAQHEFNLMLAYRQKIPAVFMAVHDIRKIMRDARDFDENPAKKIEDSLVLMETEIRSWGEKK